MRVPSPVRRVSDVLMCSRLNSRIFRIFRPQLQKRLHCGFLKSVAFTAVSKFSSTVHPIYLHDATVLFRKKLAP